jgi:NAD(P)-dependent dehydrogenase (short-subunit alcohol dehydrogenase family)
MVQQATSQQVVWITGGGTGIGRELALLYAKAGDRVAISGRTPDTLAATALARPELIRCYPLDVTEPAEVDAGIASIEAQLGAIDLAILNAGTYAPLWVADFDRAKFRQQIETNLLGVANALDPLLKRMIARRRGTIVIVSSVAGYSGLPGAAAYGASKAALTNLAEAMYPEAQRLGVRIALVSPGFVRTPLTAQNSFEMPFLIEADDAARRIRDGIASGRFEIAFPRRFAFLLKLARRLPYALYFALTRRMLPK